MNYIIEFPWQVVVFTFTFTISSINIIFSFSPKGVKLPRIPNTLLSPYHFVWVYPSLTYQVYWWSVNYIL